jgi:RNA 3'-terminal phosphate cyclase (ATP)
MIEIDGSSGEGGGQILRTAVALASVLGLDVMVTNIRAGRSNPGLQAQHLAGVRAASEICGGTMTGARVGSSRLEYKPGKPRGGKYSFDVGTAGSVTLVLQTLMPIIAFAQGDVELHLTGGTDVKWSPPIDYLNLVTLPVLGWMGYKGSVKVGKRGYYPRGGGEVWFSSSPLEGFAALERTSPGRASEIELFSFSTGLPGHVAERMVATAKQVLSAEGLTPPKVSLESSKPEQGPSAGCGLVLRAGTDQGALLGADGLGERGKPAEAVGREAGQRLIEELRTGMFFDRHMGDMIVPFMALAEGVSKVSVSQLTQHTLTNIMVAESLAGVRFEVQGGKGEPGTIRVKGCGLTSLQVSSSK